MEKREGESLYTYTLGGSGGMLPQKILDFETASGALSGTLY